MGQVLHEFTREINAIRYYLQGRIVAPQNFKEQMLLINSKTQLFHSVVAYFFIKSLLQ